MEARLFAEKKNYQMAMSKKIVKRRKRLTLTFLTVAGNGGILHAHFLGNK